MALSLKQYTNTYKTMACSRTLSGIAMECAPQKGGILEAYVTTCQSGIFKYTVNSGSSASDVEIPETVTGVTSGLTWNKLAFRKNISNFASTGNVDDANGVSYVSTEINLVFSKMLHLKKCIRNIPMRIT